MEAKSSTPICWTGLSRRDRHELGEHTKKASLSHLIRESAIQAVSDGTEALALKLMDTIVIDERGQEHFNKTKRKKQTRRRPTGANPTSEPEAS